MWQLMSQITVSRNRKEGFRKKIIRLFWSVVFCLVALRVGLRGMKTEQLGEEVIYQGKKYRVNNWAGSERPNLSSTDGGYIEGASRSEIRNIRSLKTMLHRFNVIKSWYLMNWYGIQVNNKVN